MENKLIKMFKLKERKEKKVIEKMKREGNLVYISLAIVIIALIHRIQKNHSSIKHLFQFHLNERYLLVEVFKLPYS